MNELVHWSSLLPDHGLAEHEVHVWRAWLDLDAISTSRFYSTLSPEEKTRAAGFVLARDRDRFTVTHGILRQVLGRYLYMPPANVPIKVGPHGKPALSNEAKKDPAPLHFNLSHSDGLGLFAFSLESEVGIDVEQIRPEVAKEGIEEAYFSAREQRELDALPAESRAEGFFRCWTRKEAYVKAGGEGLLLPLDSFDTSLTPGQPAVLHRVDQERWSLYSVCPEPGFIAAVVVESKKNTLKFWEWSDQIPSLGQ
jgi:4'-phosphopantetheinyl transferase